MRSFQTGIKSTQSHYCCYLIEDGQEYCLAFFLSEQKARQWMEVLYPSLIYLSKLAHQSTSLLELPGFESLLVQMPPDDEY
jgi:hypothetical protein